MCCVLSVLCCCLSCCVVVVWCVLPCDGFLSSFGLLFVAAVCRVVFVALVYRCVYWLLFVVVLDVASCVVYVVCYWLMFAVSCYGVSCFFCFAWWLLPGVCFWLFVGCCLLVR